jgi:serine/threonine-protein phosphatase 6 regulatory ankyrin repeat subunit B
MTNLHDACKAGDENAVKSLLEANPGDVNSRDTGIYQQTLLHSACEKGHAGIAALLIEKGADVSSSDQKGRTPLHTACEKGHIDIAALLIEKGADVKSKNVWGRSILHSACEKGLVDIAALLIENGADVSSSDQKKRTLLHSACENGHIDIAALLIDKGADIKSKETWGQTPLHRACEKGLVDIAALLIEKGAEINSSDKKGQTPLLLACEKGLASTAALLLEKDGVDVNASKIKYGQTPLYWACEKGLIDIAAVLIEKGADVGSRDKDERTPLHRACERGHASTAALLIEKGADVSSISASGWTPLYNACLSGHADTAAMLIEKGADVDARDEDEQTPLHLACAKGHPDIAALLIEKGAEIKSSNKEGRTPLHRACYGGHASVAALLMDKGANVNSSDEEKWTPLHMACENGHIDIAALLVEKGADVDGRAEDKQTPLHRACMKGHPDIAALLIEKGADVDTSNKKGQTPLQLSYDSGHASVATLLIEKGTDPGSVTTISNGQTPLHWACEKGHADLATLLIEKGADVNVRLVGGSTLLHEACERGLTEIATLLVEKGGADVSMTNKGQTALDMIVKNEELIHLAKVALQVSVAAGHKQGTINNTKTWFAFLEVIAHEQDEARLERMMHDYNTFMDDSSVHDVSTLAKLKDTSGREAISIASEKCQQKMYEKMYFCGRYALDDGPPIHKSATCMVVSATDYGLVLEYREKYKKSLKDKQFLQRHEQSEQRKNLLMDKELFLKVSIGLNKEGGMNVDESKDEKLREQFLEDFDAWDTNQDKKFSEDEFVSMCKGKFGSTKKVALKFMLEKDQYDRECQQREKNELDERYVVGLLNSVTSETTHEEVKLLSKFRGIEMQNYYNCLCMPQAERNLMNIYLQERLTMSDVRKIMEDICHALKHLHGKKIVHCDLKALNVVRMDDGRYCLIDLDASSLIPKDAGSLMTSSRDCPIECYAGAKFTSGEDV